MTQYVCLGIWAPNLPCSPRSSISPWNSLQSYCAWNSPPLFLASRNPSHLPEFSGNPQGCVLSPLLYLLSTIDCLATFSSTNIVNNIVVVGLISNKEEAAYLEDIKNLETWYQVNNLHLNVSKTKKLIVDFSTKQERNYQALTTDKTLTWECEQFSVPRSLHHVRTDVVLSC